MAFDESTVHAIHDLYLKDVVEGFNLCPFARRCREDDKLKRIIFWPEKAHVNSQEVGQKLSELHDGEPIPDVLLLTFVVTEGHPWRKPEGFEEFLRELREVHQQAVKQSNKIASYYMVAFHPNLSVPAGKLNQATLVPLLRHSPDPVIQCVRAELLNEIRRQSQSRKFTYLQTKIEDSNFALPKVFGIQTDATISTEIARNNFLRVGSGEQRNQLEAQISNIMQLRNQSYRQG